MSYASWDEEMDRENEDSWPHIDLLEFIRLAILAMLFFMSLADGFRQPGLIIHVLNGQARFMVSARLLYFSSFCTCLLISLFRNGSTTSLCTRRRFPTSRTGSTNSDSGTWTCSPSSPNLNRRASTWVAIGLYSLMRSSIDLTPTFWFRLTPSSCLCLLICGISSANSRQPSSTGFRTPLNLKTKQPVPHQCLLTELARGLVVFPLVSLSFSTCLFNVQVLTSFIFLFV